MQAPSTAAGLAPAQNPGTSDARTSGRPWAKAGIGLALAGAILMALAINSALQPDPVPYERVPVAVEPASYADLGLGKGSRRDANIHRLEWRTQGVRGPVASALVATGPDSRMVALDWQNFVTEPVLSADLSIKEVGKVLAAIRQHVPETATLLSWWDLSRKIRFVSQCKAPLDDPLARGLMVPSAWSQSSDRVLSQEQAFWGQGVPKADEETFGRFIDALMMDEAAGAEALRALAPAGDVYIAVHLSDIWKAASARPDKISITYRDFAATNQAHGVIKAARQWMREAKIDGAYSVEPIGSAVRLHYLTNKESENMLLAKLLPFSESNPLLLKDFELVYQHRGFWIYRIVQKDKT
jgi:hydroxylamine oxidation protein HaoB